MIRKMTEDDLSEVLSLCQVMYQETATYRIMQFSATRIVEILKTAIRGGFATVAMESEEIIGFMAGCSVNPTFSHDLMACDYVLYILPEHRGGLSAYRLAKAYISWARELGCKLITVGVTAGIDNERAIEFYKSMGFRKSGVQLSMEA